MGKAFRFLVAALAAGAMLLAGCAPGRAPQDGGDRYDGQTIAWSPCDDRPGVECGRLTVPLDHADPAGPTVEMVVYRIQAWREAAQGVVLVLPEAPGTSGADLFGPASFTFRELGASYDVVTYDPRGTPGTLPLRCEADAGRPDRLDLDGTPDSPAEEEALRAAWQRYARDCEAAAGTALARMGTADVVRDLDLLRRTLGEKRILLYGASYGALVAREYLRTFPEGAARAVLDAPSPRSFPPAAPVGEVVEAAETTFDEALGTCFDNPFLPCPLGESPAEARTRTEELLRELDDEPRDLGPDGILTREQVVAALWDGMAEGPQGWTTVVRALGRASGGDWSELAAQSRESAARRTSDAALAVRCADGGPSRASAAEIRGWAADLAVRSPLFGETVGWWAVECLGWPVGPTLETKPRNEPDGARRGRALVVASAGDPRTPRDVPAATARQLGNAPVLTYTGAEHGAYASSPCVRYAVNDFLTAGVLPAHLTCGDLPLRPDWRRRGCVTACTVVPAATAAKVSVAGLP